VHGCAWFFLNRPLNELRYWMKKTKKESVILVVDDIPDTIDYLHAVLGNNYHIKAAISGEKAIEIASIEPLPDLILLDIMMPEMDGFSVCQILKSDEKTRDIPIIFLTAKSDDESIIKGFSIGAVDYVTKPFRLEELLARIKTHITLKSQREKLKVVNSILEQEVQERTKQLHKLLDDKGVLLQELNHRVRNNLQILTSLLSLQSTHSKNKQIKEFVQKYSHRIQTMSIAHDMIDVETTMLSIPFRHYLYNLISQIIQQYHQTDANVRFQLNMDNCTLDINIALPCGLIVNELVSNILKHAIPAGEKGTITVSFSQRPDQVYVLELMHDGRGFKEAIDFQKQPTLGLKLVGVLTNQLKGSITYDPDKQTYLITFKNPDIRSYNPVHG
jgi:two-component sensor histidine kinase